MFKVMKTKMMGIHAINVLRYGPVDGQPDPPRLKLWMMRRVFKRMGVTEAQLTRWAGNLAFEYGWWKQLGRLRARSFDAVVRQPVPSDFNTREALLGRTPPLRTVSAVEK